MSQVQSFPKSSGETRVITFDFISQLAVGETISTQSVAAAVWSGVDANPSAVISGTATATGTKVMQAVTGGVVGTIYKLTCTITTSLGQTLRIFTYLPIVDNPL